MVEAPSVKSLEELIDEQWQDDAIPRLLDETDEEFRERIKENLSNK